MPADQHVLTFAASDAEKVLLGGESEQNFVRLENALGVRLLTRNAGVTVQAENEAAAQKAVATLVKMRETLKTGQHLSEFYVDELLHLSGGKTEGRAFVPSQEKPVLIDRYGKPVQPKTRGQAKFLQIIREHDIVFAAGPAGSKSSSVGMMRPARRPPTRTSSRDSEPSLFQSCTAKDRALPFHSSRSMTPFLLRSMPRKRMLLLEEVEELAPPGPQ
jgi:hypothetical protein